MSLQLRPLTTADKDFFQENVETTRLLLSYDPETDWQDYVAMIDGNVRGASLPPGHVPSTFLVAVNPANEIVGRVSIRHHLNDQLTKIGGHIGYIVEPKHRRKGYATAILQQALVIARSLDIDDVLITCDSDNVGSKKVIEKCGGELFDDATYEAESHLRYWIRKR